MEIKFKNSNNWVAYIIGPATLAVFYCIFIVICSCSFVLLRIFSFTEVAKVS